MKHMRKLSSLLLALVLALAVAVPAFAAETDTATRFVAPPNGTATKYELFKVMGADWNGGSFENYEWPTGNDMHFHKDKFVEGMKALPTQTDTDMEAAAALARELFGSLTGTSSDKDIAMALDTLRNRYADQSGVLVAQVLDSVGVRTEIPAWKIDTPLDGKPGYYMVKATFADGSSKLSLYNVKGDEGPIEIQEKSAELPPDQPEVYKKVWDATEQKWMDATNCPEGEEFKFQLSTPIKGFDHDNLTHDIVFHDRMDGDQLKIPEDRADFEVYIIRQSDNARADISNFVLEPGALDTCSLKNAEGTECAFHVSFDAAAVVFPDGGKVQNGDMVYVEYKSQLLPKADVGAVGNKNSVWVESNGKPSEVVEVTVFTLTLVADKKDGERKTALPGAVFTLSKWDGTKWEAIEELGYPVHTDAAGKPIDDKDQPVDLTAEGAHLWYEVKNEDGTVSVVAEAPEDAAHFQFSKLGEGRYKLEETKYPMTADGKKYNEAGPYYFQVEIEYEVNEAGKRVGLKETKITVQDETGKMITENQTIELNVGTDKGTISTEIMNNTGFQMPSTGGIGTTIFYIVGGILAAGAVILLITKRRMRVEEE